VPKKPQVRTIREEIAKRRGIRDSRIYQMASALAIKAQTKTEDGILLLAAQSGINLNRYLSKEKVDRIRGLLFQLDQHPSHPHVANLKPIKPAATAVTVTIGRTLAFSDPLLTPRSLAEAKQMAEDIYPLLYVFENSVRQLIVRVLEKAHGATWWDTKVAGDIRQEVGKRKAKEDQNPWHGKRAAHPIYYTDLEHLARIVQNNWPDFKAILPSQQWLSQRVEEIAQSRNPVAHMNPLNKDDIQRIKVYCRDWAKLIAAKRNLIP
jgi:Swt1-like HEPN